MRVVKYSGALTSEQEASNTNFSRPATGHRQSEMFQSPVDIFPPLTGTYGDGRTIPNEGDVPERAHVYRHAAFNVRTTSMRRVSAAADRKLA